MSRVPNKEGLICFACRRCYLDYPFVHQSCQHIVCAKCSYQKKAQTYCIRCQDALLQAGGSYAVQATTNGYCEQLATIIESRHKDIFTKPREELFRDAAGAYAEATVSSSKVISTGLVRQAKEPVIERPPTGMETCCHYSCCCCVLQPCGRGVSKVIRVVWTIIGVLLIIWMLNYYFTGSQDLRNLPVFGWIPSAHRAPHPETPAKEAPFVFKTHNFQTPAPKRDL